MNHLEKKKRPDAYPFHTISFHIVMQIQSKSAREREILSLTRENE
jgi:hypothetical protein